MLTIPIAATTSWPDAALGLAGIVLVGAVAVVVIWQGLITWRSRLAGSPEVAYRELAQRTIEQLDEINRRLAALERDTGGTA